MALNVGDDSELTCPSSPQPFATSELVVCGNAYPSDRIYVDDKAFLANVPIEVSTESMLSRNILLTASPFRTINSSRSRFRTQACRISTFSQLPRLEFTRPRVYE